MYSDNYSEWFVRDQSKKSAGGIFILLNEHGTKKYNRPSLFIEASDNQYQLDSTKRFNGIRVPLVRFYWYVVQNLKREMILSAQDYISQQLQEKEKKKAEQLLSQGQGTLEEYDPEKEEIEERIRSCRHKIWLRTFGDFQTCSVCRMRKCLTCGIDFSYEKNAHVVAKHFGIKVIDLRYILSMYEHLNGNSNKLRCQIKPEELDRSIDFVREMVPQKLEDWL